MGQNGHTVIQSYLNADSAILSGSSVNINPVETTEKISQESISSDETVEIKLNVFKSPQLIQWKHRKILWENRRHSRKRQQTAKWWTILIDIPLTLQIILYTDVKKYYTQKSKTTEKICWK